MDNVGSVISLFTFAVDCLGRIQLVRDFIHDFNTHQLKLDLIQLRLSRWGEAAGRLKVALLLEQPSMSSRQ